MRLRLYFSKDASQEFLLKQIILEELDRECVECLIYAPTHACDLQLLHSIQSLLLWIKTYLGGNQPQILPPLHWPSSKFALLTLKALASIPFGTTLTYQELATLIGSPQGARAVGSALNKNPFPFLLPCHRIVSKRDGLGGFAFPRVLKTLLLAFERS